MQKCIIPYSVKMFQKKILTFEDLVFDIPLYHIKPPSLAEINESLDHIRLRLSF